MEMPETPFRQWTRANLYPKLSRNEGVLSVTDKFYCPASAFDIDQLAELETIEYRGLKVSSSSAEFDEAGDAPGGLVYITLVYSKSNSDSTSAAADGVSEFTMEDSGQELPIDMRKKGGGLRFENYKTNMNYVLAAKNGITASYSGWIGDDKTEMSNDNADKYRWCKDASDVPDGWYVLKGKTKSIESVLVPSPVVVETTKYQTYNQACSKRSRVGNKATPAKTFGITGEWLVMSSNVYSDGRKWVCQTRYQNADEWDGDFYS
jgi:hypothetical protein